MKVLENYLNDYYGELDKLIEIFHDKWDNIYKITQRIFTFIFISIVFLILAILFYPENFIIFLFVYVILILLSNIWNKLIWKTVYYFRERELDYLFKYNRKLRERYNANYHIREIQIWRDEFYYKLNLKHYKIIENKKKKEECLLNLNRLFSDYGGAKFSKRYFRKFKGNCKIEYLDNIIGVPSSVCILYPQSINMFDNTYFKIKTIVDMPHIIDFDTIEKQIGLMAFCTINNELGLQRYELYYNRKLIGESDCPFTYCQIQDVIKAISKRIEIRI